MGDANKTMEKSTLMWVIIGILFLAVLFLTYKVTTLSAGVTGNIAKIDTSGWSENEIMNYEMHGTVPARVSSSSTSAGSSGGMVGGC